MEGRNEKNKKDVIRRQLKLHSTLHASNSSLWPSSFHSPSSNKSKASSSLARHPLLLSATQVPSIHIMTSLFLKSPIARLSPVTLSRSRYSTLPGSFSRKEKAHEDQYVHQHEEEKAKAQAKVAASFNESSPTPMNLPPVC